MGSVDGAGHALVSVTLSNPHTHASIQCDAWIDTGFTGEVVLPQARIVALGLTGSAAVPAVLADGSIVNLPAYDCLISWLGQEVKIQVVANQGQYPLIGVGLLDGHYLAVDYQNRTVEIR